MSEVKHHPDPAARIAFRLAPLGLACLAAGTLLSATHFHEPYSPLNHFISELGSCRSSTMAWAFNTSLVVASPLLFSMVWALARRLHSGIGYTGLATGFVAMLAAAGVGLVPMENLWPHIYLALTFFCAWLVSALIFSAAVWQRYRLRSGATLAAGILAELAGGVFLIIVFRALSGGLAIMPAGVSLENFQRPAVWSIAITEWSVVASMLAWIVAIGHLLWRRDLQSESRADRIDHAEGIE